MEYNPGTEIKPQPPEMKMSAMDLVPCADKDEEAKPEAFMTEMCVEGSKPGPHQVFFSDVTQFDLTDFAGQKRRTLRTMEPVAEIIGHCFVVGD